MRRAPLIAAAPAFLEAIKPVVEANLAEISDDASERSGEGWSGTMTCGACPVQIEGDVDGMRFHFRARGSAWSFSVGKTDEDAVRASFQAVPDGWMTDGWAEGDGDFSGSWMPYSEAWRHITESITAWRAVRVGGAL